jgi:hypothetical protein
MSRNRRSLEATIIALAIAVRIAAVLVLRNHEVARSTYEHGEIAANLLAGRGFSIRFLGADGPTSQQAPIYPLVVASAYAIGGVGTPRALLVLETGQCLLGGILVWGVMRLARRVAPERCAIAAAAGFVAALHPTLVYAATHVQVAGLGATLLVWTLAWAYRTASSGRPRHAAITGGFLALLALTDPILSLATIGIAWTVWQGSRGAIDGRRRFVILTSLTMVVGLLGIAPWLVRNVRVHGEFVAIKSTFGYAFWQGNCALSEGTDKVRRESIEPILRRGQEASSLSGLNRALWDARHEAGYLDDIALTGADKLWLGAFPEPERSRILFRRALADLAADPWRYPLLCLRRLRYFVLFDETNPKSRVLVYRASHLGLTLIALVGLLLAGPETRSRLMPTIAVAAAIALFHTLTIVSARFHIPLEPLMAIWGAAGLARWETRSPRRAASAPAPHHVERVGVEGRLGMIQVGQRAGIELLLRPGLQERQDEARDQAAGADQDGTSPGDAGDCEVVGRHRPPVEAGHEGAEDGGDRDTGADGGHAPGARPAPQPGEGLRAVHGPHPLEMLPLAPLVTVLQHEYGRDQHQGHQDADDGDDERIHGLLIPRVKAQSLRAINRAN